MKDIYKILKSTAMWSQCSYFKNKSLWSQVCGQSEFVHYHQQNGKGSSLSRVGIVYMCI